MHISKRIVFERSIGHAHDDDRTTSPSPIGAREWIDDAVSGREYLARIRLASALCRSRSLVDFTKFFDVATGFPDERDDAWRRRIDDCPETAIFLADSPDIEPSMTTSIAIVLAHEIAIGIGLGVALGNRQTEFGFAARAFPCFVFHGAISRDFCFRKLRRTARGL